MGKDTTCFLRADLEGAWRCFPTACAPGETTAGVCRRLENQTRSQSPPPLGRSFSGAPAEGWASGSPLPQRRLEFVCVSVYLSVCLSVYLSLLLKKLERTDFTEQLRRHRKLCVTPRVRSGLEISARL